MPFLGKNPVPAAHRSRRAVHIATSGRAQRLPVLSRASDACASSCARDLDVREPHSRDAYTGVSMPVRVPGMRSASESSFVPDPCAAHASRA
ncbi:hypothetical protein IG631_22575 [Alternaria alternata]|nr:hypothetical protein IG631_22575 [Alternaria alternata]